MNSYISKFACIPYLNPAPPNPNLKSTTLDHEVTLSTLFEEFPFQYIPDRTEKIRMFQNLKSNLPIICNLQSDHLPINTQPNKMNLSIMNFLSKLEDSSCHIFSLCPIVRFDPLKLDYLLKRCLDNRTVLEKAIWIIHHYSLKTKISIETMTKTITEIQPPDPIFAFHLWNRIYRNNLLNHTTFLKWAISTAHPKYLTNFYKDLVSTHSLLRFALSSTSAVDGSSNFQSYYDLLKEKLVKNQSHVIQLAILCENKNVFSPKQAKLIYRLMSSNKAMLKRARRIHQILLSNIYKNRDSASLLASIIFKDFPRFDFGQILKGVRSLSFFLSDSKKSRNALEICKTVNNRFNDTTSIPPIAAWLIRKLNLRLRIGDFCEWMYGAVESFDSANFLNGMQSLFYELQYQGVLNYKEFLSHVHSIGYCSTKPLFTQKIISEMPILLFEFSEFNSKSRNVRKANQCLPKLLLDLHNFFPNDAIVSKLKKISENVNENIQIIKCLPFVARFMVASWLVSLDMDPKFLCDMLNEIDVSMLIPELSKKSDFVPKNAKHFLAVYEAHGMRSKIENVFLHDVSYQMPVDNVKVRGFFDQFSYLCSLHLLDFTYSIQNSKDLSISFTIFFKDLFSFKNISYSHFFSFFSEFYQSMIVPNSIHFFLTMFLSSCFIKSNFFIKHKDDNLNLPLNDIESDDRKPPKFHDVSTFAAYFVRDLIIQKVIKPHEYITTSFEVIHSREIAEGQYIDHLDDIFRLCESLFQIIFKVIDDEINIVTSFESTDFLTPEVAAKFESIRNSFDSDQTAKESIDLLYHNFLSRLRSLKPPQTCANYTDGFKCVLYSLLPTEFFSDDSSVIFDFFKKNVNQSNLHLFCSWLRDRPEFESGFPIAQHVSLLEGKKLKYITELVDTFWNCESGKFIDSPELCAECWWILCESKSVANAVIRKCINKSFFLFDNLHPAIVSSDEAVFESLCDKLRETDSNSLNKSFVEMAASVFVIFVSKFGNNERFANLVVNVANRMLEWLAKLWEEESDALLTLIDAFNFIVCWSFNPEDIVDKIESHPSLAFGFGARTNFQEMLHTKITPNFSKLPKELQKKIILNKPRQAFIQVKNPLFADFVVQEFGDSQSQFQINPSFNDNWNFEDVENLFWG